MFCGTVRLLKAPAILFACFVVFLAGCSREQPAEVLSASFDGTLQPSKGSGFAGAKFEADYAGYLTRRSLRLHCGQIITYDVSRSGLSRGSVQVWFRQGFTLPKSPVHFLQLSTGAAAPELDLSLSRKGMALAVREKSQESSVSHTAQYALTPGVWQMLVLSWTGSDVRLYADEQLIASSAFHASPSKVSVGLWTDQVCEDDQTLTVRDLAVFNEAVDEKWIRASLQSHPVGVPKLVYRLRDLTHWNGKAIKDPEASGGLAWTPDTLLAKSEGVLLPSPGDYELTFLVKASTNIHAGSLHCTVWNSDQNGNLNPLASRDNQENELQKQPRYQPFTIHFHAAQKSTIAYQLHCTLPGKYSMLLDTATVRAVRNDWKDVRRVEDLQHTMGIWKTDPEAASGRAWGIQNALNIGPYTCIGQPGRYRATWRIKVSGEVPANTPLVLLKIFSHDGYFGHGRSGNKDYAAEIENSDGFAQKDVWTTRTLEFDYDGSDMIEFIAHAKLLDPGTTFFDTITIEPIGK
jgi:hypothetical protein